MSVHHNQNESAQVVNFKKGIAAAFQANFNNTHIEMEEDTQSKHHAKYRLLIIFNNSVAKCHRP